MSTKMRAVVINKYGREDPQLTQVDIPKISPTEVLVEIQAASINPIDLKVKAGKLKLLLKYKMPLILGNDFSGIVVKVGNQVKKFKVGDEVYGRPRKSKIGTFADYIAIDEEDISLKPQNIDFYEAAGIPLVGLTSYQAFYEKMQLQPKDKVLIQAGSGGVGTFAIQLAKVIGAQVATTTSKKNESLVKELGADVIVDYRNNDFSEALEGYDYVFDTLGGVSLIDSFKVLKPGGKIITISGVPNYRFAKEYGLNFIKRQILKIASAKLTKLEKKYGVQYDFLFMHPSGTQLAAISDLIESKKIKPIVDKIFSLEDITEALAYSASGRAVGKIIIKVK